VSEGKVIMNNDLQRVEKKLVPSYFKVIGKLCWTLSIV
jgi:hypothetical protein